MKKFLLCNQDDEPMFETSGGHFTCGILELYDVFVVRVSTVEGDSVTSYPVAVYRDVQEAADAVAALKDFALKTTKANSAFAFPTPSEPVTPLELLANLEVQL